jgi:uncharacterized protein with von Willebrand factor type A (vWA) domain
VSETLDATRAAALTGVHREVLRAALAATLVKDHADRPVFDATFDRYFGVTRPTGRKGPRRREEEGSGHGDGAEGQGGQPRADGQGRGEARREQRERASEGEAAVTPRRAARSALLAKPFHAMDARDSDELRDLARVLARRYRARWSRRARRANLGRLDMRRTIRRATTRGGVPLELLYRRWRPGKSDLVALVDLSYSTATAANFLLALLAPAQRFFRRAVCLGYVDAISEVSFEHGHVVPHQPLDLNARSDFGRVLRQTAERYGARLRRDTVLLILGDARNNRRPPRADLLADLQHAARAVVWLNPEERGRWDTGDSVMSAYARRCTQVINAWNPRTLMTALDRLIRAGT